MSSAVSGLVVVPAEVSGMEDSAVVVVLLELELLELLELLPPLRLMTLPAAVPVPTA